MKKNRPTKNLALRPKHVLSLVFTLFFIVSGLTIGGFLANNQDVRSQADGHENKVVGCNQQCKFNRDCQINFRCYHGACRLATSPDNSNCQTSPTTSVNDTTTTTPTLILPNQHKTTTQQVDSETKTGYERLRNDSQQTSIISVWYNKLSTLISRFFSWIKYIFSHPQYRLPATIFTIGLALIIIATTIRNKNRKSKRMRSLEMSPKQVAHHPTAQQTMTDRIKQKQIKTPQ